MTLPKDRLFWMPWFPGDFMRSTRGWTVTQRGVYRELLDAQWDMGALPVDEGALRRAIGATEAEWAMAWPGLVDDKFPVSGGARRNARLEEHRRLTVHRREAGHRGGIRSAEARQAKGQANGQANPQAKWQANLQANGAANGVPSYSESYSESESESESDPESQDLLSPLGLTLEPARPKAARRPDTRLPDDFHLTDERAAYAKTHGVDPGHAFAMFSTYWRSASGRNGTKRNWDQAWQHWVLKDQKTVTEKRAPKKTRYQEIQEMRHGHRK